VISEVIVTQLLMFIHQLTASDGEDGQGLAEYALILALIAITAIIALLFLGSQVSDKLSVIGDTIDSVAP
jgi:Flp pilus assembly pilin Flp